MPEPVRLSVCMIVRNEAAVLGACLASVREIADELIIVDTGSTDGTVAIASEFEARVIEMPWPGDFSLARNRSLEAASGRWILVLDADETLRPEAQRALRTLTEAPAEAAYKLVQVGSDYLGMPMRMEIVRLFPNRPDIRFTFPIHEQVDPALARAGVPVLGCGIELQHSGYDSPEKSAAKRAQYRRLIEEALARSPDQALALHLRYLSGVTYFEDKQWSLAADEFEWCVAHVPSPTVNMARVARLRTAECRILSGEPSRALAFLPREPDPAEHPAALYYRGKIELSAGRISEALPWYRALLHVDDQLFYPPVDLSALKAAAAADLRR